MNETKGQFAIESSDTKFSKGKKILGHFLQNSAIAVVALVEAVVTAPLALLAFCFLSPFSKTLHLSTSLKTRTFKALSTVKSAFKRSIHCPKQIETVPQTYVQRCTQSSKEFALSKHWLYACGVLAFSGITDICFSLIFETPTLNLLEASKEKFLKNFFKVPNLKSVATTAISGIFLMSVHELFFPRAKHEKHMGIWKKTVAWIFAPFTVLFRRLVAPLYTDEDCFASYAKTAGATLVISMLDSRLLKNMSYVL